jgi:hypothetical protein
MKRKRGVFRNIFVMGAVVLLIAAILIPNVTGGIKPNKISISSLKNLKEKSNSNRFINNPFRTRTKNQVSLFDLFSGTVHTDCAGIKKSTKILFAILNGIDVDNNPNTGINGQDIKVRYILLPIISTGSNLAIGLSFVLNFERIGDEIKNEDFTATMEIGQNNIRYGFWSPDETGNEIPSYVSVAFSFIFYVTEGTRGFRFDLNPEYTNDMSEKKIILFAEHNGQETQRSFSFEFDPVMAATAEIKSTLIGGRWQYMFTRSSPWDSKVTTTYTMNDGEEKTTKFIVDRLPQDISFELGFTPFSNGGGKLVYESSRMFDIELSVESNQMGTCKYATLRNTPKKMTAEWKPTIQNGYYNVNIESDGTEFTLQDSLTSPDKCFTLSNLENIDIKTSWNLSNPGDIFIEKTAGLNANLELQLGEWTATVNSQFTSDHIKMGWGLDVSGYLNLDTDWEPLTTTDIMIMSENLGLKTVGEGLKAEDFELFWTIWPPAEWDITSNGQLDFASITMDLYSEGTWYHLWPW